MAGERLLWTGPYGAVLRDYALAGASADPSSLWMVPSAIARDQVRRELAIRSGQAGPGPRVWCWSDLWKSVRGELEGGRACLSAGAAVAVFGEAVRQARQAGELQAIASVIDWPGYRRQLRARIADWTASEKRTRDPAPENPVAAAEWAVFVRYRRLLGELKAADETGFAVWVARRLSPPPATLSTLDQVTFLDWESPSRAHWRVLDYALRTARSVRVTLAYEPGASSGALYESTSGVRDRLRALAFDEVPVPRPDIWRPAGLRAVECALFRQDFPGHAAGSAGVSVTQGLTIRGAPQGEGAGRLLAREVRALLDAGADPEDVLVVFPDWSEQADIALELMRDWGLPVHAEPARPLGSDPAVAALLLAVGLPVGGWVTDHLIRLLRNGQVRPDWPGADPYSLAASASVIKTSSVFRGREPLLRWLERAVSEGKGGTVKAHRARIGLETVSKLFALLAPLDQPRRFAAQVVNLLHIVETLHLGDPDDAGLDQLRDALEDQAGILEWLGRGDEPWRWSAFVREVESIVLDLKVPAPPMRPGSVRMATVGQVEGARAAYVILADLAELTFPAGDAVEAFLSLRPGALPDEASRRAFSREMLRFLRVIGSADSGVVLIYPTTNAKGQELLRAGFLDELIELLTPEAAAACHVSIGRVDPALVDSPELAGSPGDRRVRATALARTRGDLSALSVIAGRPAHRRVLEGTAAALQVLASRTRGTPFAEYDGLLSDGNVVLDIADTFNANYRFSASQLETYIACPFQFFCKYVLKLEPAERRDEIDEDYTERGSRIHNILEQLEQMKQNIRDDETPEDLARIAVGAELNVEMVDASEVDLGLAEIERRRLIQTIERYLDQLREYDNDPSARPIPHRFEVGFGAEASDFPHLEIGRGPRAVRLQGKIDRIDLVDSPEGRGFRVIDYKSGAGPSPTDVRSARYLQLPLYAMAVEQIILPDRALTLRDVGYWALRKDGYKAIAFAEWKAVREALESYVAELVERLRRGVFVVDSQVDGCEGFCDFRAICRIRQARLASKHHDRAIAPELAVERSRSTRKHK
ncbi:MAG: PD-(D/E)XK nuclease family protein [Isosphaeraceae bacterium]